MGCDIHAYAEKHDGGAWRYVGEAFVCRSYGLFGFLANIRNYSAVPAIAPSRGIPDGISEQVRKELENWDLDGHSHSYVGMGELESFDYDAPMEDRRCARTMPGGWTNFGTTCDPGEGEMTTYREFLGEWYFAELERLRKLGTERIVFWFDN